MSSQQIPNFMSHHVRGTEHLIRIRCHACPMHWDTLINRVKTWCMGEQILKNTELELMKMILDDAREKAVARGVSIKTILDEEKVSGHGASIPAGLGKSVEERYMKIECLYCKAIIPVQVRDAVRLIKRIEVVAGPSDEGEFRKELEEQQKKWAKLEELLPDLKALGYLKEF